MKNDSREISEEFGLVTKRQRITIPWKTILACYAIVITAGALFLCLAMTDNPVRSLIPGYTAHATSTEHGGLFRRWGGYEERPMDNKCYRQERTAMILSITLGSFGVDQWYAHHWALAIFKMGVGCLGFFALFLALISHSDLTFFMAKLCTKIGLLSPLWCFIDVILWMVGGIYGTPECPGGSGGWRY